MNTFVNFLIDNYVWFLVFTLILLFSLIGFLVENSKEPKEKKIKEPKEKSEKPKKEKKDKPKKSKIKDDILEDNTPTVEEAMKMEEEKKQKETVEVEKLDTPLEIKTEEPIIIESNEEKSDK